MNKDEAMKVHGIVGRRLFDKNGKEKMLFRANKLWFILKRIFNIDLQVQYLTGAWTLGGISSNTVTTKGKEIAQKRLSGQAINEVNYVALGIGSPAATALGSEITTLGGQRAIASVSSATTTTTNDTARLIKTFTFTGSFAITEEGLFNAASAGDMFASQSFPAVNVLSGDSLQITHDVVAG